MARFEVSAITYPDFVAGATAQYGEEWARQHCAEYGRRWAKDCRTKAETAAPEDAAALRRLADRMDPDLYQIEAVSDAPA